MLISTVRPSLARAPAIDSQIDAAAAVAAAGTVAAAAGGLSRR